MSLLNRTIVTFAMISGLVTGCSCCRQQAPSHVLGAIKIGNAASEYRKENGHPPMYETFGPDDKLLSPDEYDRFIAFLKKETSYNLSSRDLWKRRFRVAVDYDGDGVISPGLVNGRTREVRLRGCVVVWSLGPDGKEEIPFSGPRAPLNSDNILIGTMPPRTQKSSNVNENDRSEESGNDEA